MDEPLHPGQCRLGASYTFGVKVSVKGRRVRRRAVVGPRGVRPTAEAKRRGKQADRREGRNGKIGFASLVLLLGLAQGAEFVWGAVGK